MSELLELCIECYHPIGWHFDPTETEIPNGRNSSKPNPCQWAISDKGRDCPCAAFRNPEPVRRREAIEHTRRKLRL